MMPAGAIMLSGPRRRRQAHAASSKAEWRKFPTSLDGLPPEDPGVKAARAEAEFYLRRAAEEAKAKRNPT